MLIFTFHGDYYVRERVEFSNLLLCTLLQRTIHGKSEYIYIKSMNVFGKWQTLWMFNIYIYYWE